MKLVKIKDVILNKISGEWGEEADESNSTPVIRTANFRNNGKVDFDNLVFRNIPTHKINAKRLIDGDVIIEKSGGSPTQPVGRVVFFANSFGKTFLCNNFTSILRPDKELVFPEFLFYVLFYNHKMGKTLRFQNKTTGIINLQLDKYLESEIPLPSLAEQIQIATVLSKAENLIAKRKQSIELLDEFVKSMFLEMFGDPVRNEKGWEIELCEKSVDILTGYPFKSNEYIEDNTQIKLCGGLIIMPDKIEWEKCIYWPKSKMQNLERYELKENDIVLAMDRPWISNGFKIGMIKNEDLPTLLIQRTARLRAKLLNQIFLYHLMKSGVFEKHCRPTETTVPHISIKDINSFKLINPPLPLQNQFAEIVNKVEVLKEKYQKSLEELENLYGSLSQRAFRGELCSNAELQIKDTSSIPENRKGFAKQVLGGKIVSLFKDDENFTNIKFQKLQYLAEHLAEEELLPNYYKEAAGPYDNRFMHTVFNHLEKNKWFKPKNLKFYPMEKVEDVGKYFQRFFGEKSDKLNNLFNLLRRASEKFCEAIATIYAVWNNHIIQGFRFDKERIKKEFFEWSNRKTEIFTEEEFEKALEWMQRHQIIPTGFGKLIKEKK